MCQLFPNFLPPPKTQKSFFFPLPRFQKLQTFYISLQAPLSLQQNLSLVLKTSSIFQQKGKWKMDFCNLQSPTCNQIASFGSSGQTVPESAAQFPLSQPVACRQKETLRLKTFQCRTEALKEITGTVPNCLAGTGRSSQPLFQP